MNSGDLLRTDERNMRAALIATFGLSIMLAGCGTADDSPEPTDSVDEHSHADPGTPGGGKSDSFADDPDSVWEEIESRCGPPAEDEAVVFGNDFSWGYSLESMTRRYGEIYASGKRLDDRAYYDAEAETFVLPLMESWGGDVTLPRRLVENVTLHIEHALEREYVDFIFFPDMGHSHLFIPVDRWETEYADIPVSQNATRYERMFGDPELMMLYHTAEQLEFKDEDGEPLADRRVQWRYHTRNIVGDNDYERRLEVISDFDDDANTARDMDGYHYYSAGFNISASEDGCFPFEHGGETFWYDLSLSDLPWNGGI